MIVTCTYCKTKFEKEKGAVTRTIKRKGKHFCSLACSGAAKRKNKTVKQKKKEKAEYDKKFREINAERIKAEKAAAFKLWYSNPKNRKLAAKRRKANMHKHVEYCRQPWYKEWKKEYDKKYLAKKEYGEFGEAALALFELERELDDRITQEMKYDLGKTNKSQNRKRKWQRLMNASR